MTLTQFERFDRDEIMQALSQIMQATDDDKLYDRMEVVMRRLRKWQEHEQIPFRNELIEWGLLPTSVSNGNEEATDTPPGSEPIDENQTAELPAHGQTPALDDMGDESQQQEEWAVNSLEDQTPDDAVEQDETEAINKIQPEKKSRKRHKSKKPFIASEESMILASNEEMDSISDKPVETSQDETSSISVDDEVSINPAQDIETTGMVAFSSTIREEPSQAKEDRRKDQIDVLFARIRSARTNAIEAGDEDEVEDLAALQKALAKWKAEGFAGQLPSRKLLNNKGLLVGLDLEYPAGDVVPASFPVPQTDGSGASINKDSQNAKTITPESPVAVYDPDEHLRTEYDDALDFEKQHKYYEAKRRLEELLQKTSGGLKSPVQFSLDAVVQKLNQQTQEMIARAEETAQNFPQNIDRQIEAWSAVLRVNPDEAQAVLEAQNLRCVLEVQQARRAVDQLREDVAEATLKKDILQLDSLVASMAVYAKAADDEHYPDDFATEVRVFQKSLQEARQKVRDELGVVATFVTQDATDKAYRKAREFSEKSISHLVDDGNIMKMGEGAIIPTKVMFEEIRKRYVDELRAIVDRRIEQAQEQMGLDPELAQQTLIEAEEFANSEILNNEDRLLMADHAKKVEERLKIVRQRLKDYTTAKAIVVSTQSPEARILVTPKERLSKLKEAKQLYPDYRDIDKYILEATRDYNDALAGHLDICVSEAKQKANRYDFELAITSIRTEITNARNDVPRPEEGSKLELAMKSASDLMNKLVEEEKRYRNVLELIEKAEKSIKSYDEKNDQNALREASETYREISSTGLKLPRIDQLHISLVTRRDDPQNHEDGKREYETKDWSKAVATLSKIEQKYARYDETRQLRMRAQAALDVLDATILEQNREYSKAYGKYRSAVYLIDGNNEDGSKGCGTDEFTNDIAIDARSGFQRLQAIQEHDQELRPRLDAAKAQLATAISVCENRPNLVDKLNPIPLFYEVVRTLNAITQETTNLAGEAQQHLSVAYQEWRKAYLNGMYAVLCLQMPGRELVTKAFHLAKVLDENALINNPEENLAYARLQTLLLDQEFETWFPFGLDHALRQGSMDISLDWMKVEENRRKRLDLSKEISLRSKICKDRPKQRGGEDDCSWLATVMQAAEREDVQQIEMDVRKISRARVRSEVQRLITKTTRADGSRQTSINQNENYLEAQRYLEDQLNRSNWLSADATLVELLIELYWKTENWDFAQLAIRRLSNNLGIADGANRVQIWGLLTEATRAFSQDLIPRGLAFFEEVRESDTYSEFEQQFENKIDITKEETRDRLIADAQAAIRSENTRQTNLDGIQNSESGYLVAARKYALAYQLDPSNKVIEQSLENISQQLSGEINGLCSRSDALSVGNQPIEQVIQQATSLVSTLVAIDSVSDLLMFRDELLNRIRRSLSDLQPKLERWNSYKKLSVEFESAYVHALSTPQPIELIEEVGGWAMDGAESVLREMKQTAARDINLLKSSNVMGERLSRAKESAEKLNTAVREFLQAYYDEKFDLVISYSKTLEDVWKSVRGQEPRWDGLEALIRQTYAPWFHKEALTLRDHRDFATRQREDLERWTRWSGDVLRNYEEIRRGAKSLNKPLEDLVQECSVRELREKCIQLVSSCKKFRDGVENKPADGPLSQKSEALAGQITKSMSDEIDSSQTLISDRQTEIDKWYNEHITGNNGTLTRMKRAKDTILTFKSQKGFFKQRQQQPVPPSMLDNLNRCIEELRHYDPFNEELLKTEQFYKQERGIDA